MFPLRIFFDGQCPLCSREVQHYLTRDPQHNLMAIDIAAPDFNPQSYGLDPGAVHAVMHAIDAAGNIYTRVDAFLAIWQGVTPSTPIRLAQTLIAIPFLRKIADVAYITFARNRYRLTGRCTPQSCPPVNPDGRLRPPQI